MFSLILIEMVTYRNIYGCVYMHRLVCTYISLFCRMKRPRNDDILVAMNTLGNSGCFLFLLEDNCFTYCAGFCHPSTWISHRYAYTLPLRPPPTPLPTPPLEVPQSSGLSALCHTANPHRPSIAHTVMDALPGASLNSSRPLLPPPGPQVCSPCPCLHRCPAQRRTV